MSTRGITRRARAAAGTVRRRRAARAVRWGRTAAIGAAALGLLLAGTAGTPTRAAATDPTVSTRPNIIFFLTDDMDSSLLRFMPNTRRLIFDRGARFDSYFTDVGLCCPARASILTGEYALNTGVIGNMYPDGFMGFHNGDEQTNTFALSLQGAGYTTMLEGKYLNEYDARHLQEHGLEPTYVPPGWTHWDVPVVGMFRGRNYVLNSDGRLESHDTPEDYLGDLTERRMLDAIRQNTSHEGLMVEFSSFAPHVPAPTSPIERGDDALRARVRRISYPRTPAFDERNVGDKPGPVRRLARLSGKEVRTIDRMYRRRILADLSIDRYVGDVYQALRSTGQLDNTYLVFTSDNGFHLGDHRLRPGKNAPYDTDIKLPFGIAGPGIAPGTHVGQLASNLDIAPTFAEIAGLAPSPEYDGASLLPLAQGRPAPGWPTHFLIQRGLVDPYGAVDGTEEPGVPGETENERAQAQYFGVVAHGWRYVDNRNAMDELYDVAKDPYEVRNLLAYAADRDRPAVQAQLDRMRGAETALLHCRGVVECSAP